MEQSWQLKLARAEQHLVEFKTGIDSYSSSQPYDAVRIIGGPRCHEHADCWRYKLRITSQPEPRLAIVCGDVIHNARSALDHLAVALVPRRNRSRASFPIEHEDIWAKIHRRYVVRDAPRRAHFQSAINGMAARPAEIVRELQPYNAGERARFHGLHLLSRLDNADKHRQLILLAAGLNDTVATVSAGGERIDLAIPDFPDAPHFTYHNAVVAHFGFTRAQPPESKVDVRVGGTLVVAIKVQDEVDSPHRSPGYMPILLLLETLIQHIRTQVFPALEPYVQLRDK